MSLWPLTYLVVECTTRSAARSIGVCSAGGKKRVVHGNQRTGPARCGGDRPDVGNAQQWIACRFQPYQSQGTRQAQAAVGRVIKINPFQLECAALQESIQQTPSTAITIRGRRHTAVTGLNQMQYRGDCSHAGTADGGRRGVLHITLGRSQQIEGRVVRATAVMGAWLAEALERKGAGHVYRWHESAVMAVILDARTFIRPLSPHLTRQILDQLCANSALSNLKDWTAELEILLRNRPGTP